MAGTLNAGNRSARVSALIPDEVSMPELLLLVVAILWAGAFVPAHADDDRLPVPPVVRGLWAEHGKCGDAASTVTIAADTLRFGANPPYPVYYAKAASPAGYDAIFSAEEGEVSNFEYVADKDVLALNAQGFGMGVERVPYTRCATAENRCGWLANLRPRDWWLVDREGTWTISAQDDSTAEAAGMSQVPDFDPRQFVSTNGDHGYGCACLQVETDKATMSIKRVLGGKVLPLRTCQADRTLPPESRW